MSLFRFEADRLPITLISLFFLTDLTIYFTVEARWFVVGWFLLSIWLKGNICAWNHHHQHCPTFRSGFANRLLEIMYGFQTGITSKGWLLHHVLGHHRNYLDQEKDESRWRNNKGQTMSVLRYTFEVAGTSFFRSVKVGRKYPRQLRDFFIMYVVQLVLLGLLMRHNWFNGLFLFLLPMVVSLVLTSWATYDHHSDLDSGNEYASSRNIMDRTYNIMTGNLGYHTAHHVKQGIHWSKIPEFHDSIKHLIPAECYLEAGIPYSWFKGTKKVGKFLIKSFIRTA